MDQSFMIAGGIVMAIVLVLMFFALFLPSLTTRVMIGVLGYVVIFIIGYFTLQTGNQAAWMAWITPMVGGNTFATWIPFSVVVVSGVVTLLASSHEKKR